MPATAPLCLSDLVRDMTEYYQLLSAERALEKTVEITPGIRIDADADLLLQTLLK